MRLGVVSDVHLTLDASARAAWHNAFDFAGLGDRIHRARTAFERAGVDAVLVCGDVTNAGDEASARAAHERLAVRLEPPVLAVAGNHDLEARDDQLERCGWEMLPPAGVDVDGVPVAGVAIARDDRGTCRWTAAEPARVVASHFPVLSRAARLAERGLAYPGDLVNRRELHERLLGTGPTLVLSGHIHVREAHAEGDVLQLSAGALIEAPYEVAIIEVSDARVRRAVHVLGPPPAERDPILAPADECWRFDGGGWRRAPA